MVINTQSALALENSCDSRGILKLNHEVINKGDLNELYRVDQGAPFATGLYAQVKRCRSLRQGNSQIYAAKFSPKKRPGHTEEEDCLENLHEIALLSQLKNPFIISFKDAFVLDLYVVTIMEFAPGGDLQSIIDADLVLLEKDASRYVFQLLEALKYLHHRHIAHLDVKPQNLLLLGEFPSCNIKLCDFEISRVIKPGMEIREILGTPDYVAPEVLQYEPLSTASDMWSVGILTYVLLTGFSPFGGDTDQETFSNILNEPVDFPEELFEDVSPAAVDFISKLVVKTGGSRPTAVEIESHEWVKSWLTSAKVEEPEPEEIVDASEVTPGGSKTTLYIPAGGGLKKKSPRKISALAGSSTASSSVARRGTARSILRACKSAYDLSKMGGKTKSREALIEKMKMSEGGNWKLRKQLSKSREQLWESKIQLSKSYEKINNNLPGSSRWASVANFPSLDLNARRSSSQESVTSVISTSANIGLQQELIELTQQIEEMNNTPVPAILSIKDENSLPPATPSEFPLTLPKELVQNNSSVATNDDSEQQKSVAELIMTFGGRNSTKKLDLKNQFEPILEVDGSEEQQMSLGETSDNNSTSGTSNSNSLGNQKVAVAIPIELKISSSDSPTSGSTSAPSPRRTSKPSFLVGSEVRGDRFINSPSTTYQSGGSSLGKSLESTTPVSTSSSSNGHGNINTTNKISDSTVITNSSPIVTTPIQTKPREPQLKGILKTTSHHHTEKNWSHLEHKPDFSSMRRGSVPCAGFAVSSKPTISSILKCHTNVSTAKAWSGFISLKSSDSADFGGKFSGNSSDTFFKNHQTTKAQNSKIEKVESSKQITSDNESGLTSVKNPHPNNTLTLTTVTTTLSVSSSAAKTKTDLKETTHVQTNRSSKNSEPGNLNQKKKIVNGNDGVCKTQNQNIPIQPIPIQQIKKCETDSIVEPVVAEVEKITVPKPSVLLLKSANVADTTATISGKEDRNKKTCNNKTSKKTVSAVTPISRPNWGYGSVSRAKTKFDSGKSRLRRGSVPDF